MTSPLAPPEDAVVLALPGLEADNLLAFLALIGLLRALETVRAAWRPRVSWRGPPFIAHLHLAAPADEDAVAQAASEGLIVAEKAYLPYAFVTAKNKKGVFETKGRKSLFPTVWRARRSKQLAIRAMELAKKRRQELNEDRCSTAAMRLNIVSSFAIEEGKDVIDTPFKLPSAQQAFVGAIYNSLRRVLSPELPGDKCSIRKALFAPWLRQHTADSLRLSPDEIRRYAYSFSAPTKTKPKTELGANALAAVALADLWMVQKQTGWRQIGYSGTRAAGEVTWPIFGTNCGVSRDVIMSIMALEEIYASEPSGKKLEPYGIIDLFRAERFVLDPQGDYGNVSWARSLWGSP